MQASSSRSEPAAARALRRCVAGAAGAMLALGAVAHDNAPHGAAAPATWGFTLPTLDGKRFVTATELRGPVVVNFWGRDCPPCVAELPRLQAFARDNPGWTVLLVATDAPAEAAAFLAQQSITLPSLRAGPRAGALMRAAGNRAGALPFTVVLREAAVCATHLGELGAAQLADWSKLPC
jgi:thiol-disulfide isomerase/thioredoxin